ncbi:hypothetical protein BDFB_001028 [Asbolus verrucosus]|uniref:Uncharacterized protein n=1 Tax=Asbolus verrucosus TaxID=1661398 RepID=A0A482W8U1_ASBVE|nr:hypothetical protein BDFB_001028 [Asbolus verrucosus]
MLIRKRMFSPYYFRVIFNNIAFIFMKRSTVS